MDSAVFLGAPSSAGAAAPFAACARVPPPVTCALTVACLSVITCYVRVAALVLRCDNRHTSPNDGPSRRPADGRIGALPQRSRLSRCSSRGSRSPDGSGTPMELARGDRRDRPLRCRGRLDPRCFVSVARSRVGFLGLMAYGLVGYLLLLPLTSVGATWEDVLCGSHVQRRGARRELRESLPLVWPRVRDLRVHLPAPVRGRLQCHVPPSPSGVRTDDRRDRRGLQEPRGGSGPVGSRDDGIDSGEEGGSDESTATVQEAIVSTPASVAEGVDRLLPVVGSRAVAGEWTALDDPGSPWSRSGSGGSSSTSGRHGVPRFVRRALGGEGVDTTVSIDGDRSDHTRHRGTPRRGSRP